MNGFHFASPWWLLLIVPAVWLVRRQTMQRRQAAVLYSSTLLVHSLPVTLGQRVRRWMPWVRLTGVTLVVIALARPQWGTERQELRVDGVAIEMCLDRSGSMQAEDFHLDGKRTNRLEAVKEVFRNFVRGDGTLPGRPQDMVGLISFGGFADGLCPLTHDHPALIESLSAIGFPEPIRDVDGRVLNEAMLREEMATAIGDALALAVDRLKDTPAKSKVIILLSDGENNSGIVDPMEAVELAKKHGIRVYTIGVGTTGLAPFPRQDLFGRTHMVNEAVKLDEKLLTQVAQATGGVYYNAQSTDALQTICAEIDKLEKTQIEGKVIQRQRELFGMVLLPGLGLILAETMLSALRFRSLP